MSKFAVKMLIKWLLSLEKAFLFSLLTSCIWTDPLTDPTLPLFRPVLRIENCNFSAQKVKASHTRYRALGRVPRLIPAYIGVLAVSPQVIVSHPPGGRLPLLSARHAVTFPATEHHRFLAGTKLYRDT